MGLAGRSVLFGFSVLSGVLSAGRDGRVVALAVEVFHLIPVEDGDASGHVASVDCPCAPVAGTFHRLTGREAMVWSHHQLSGRGGWADA